MIEQQTYFAVHAIQCRLCVCGMFDDHERSRIREICQGVLDDCSKPLTYGEKYLHTLNRAGMAV